MTKQQPVHLLQKSAALPFVEMRSANQSSSCYSTHSHDEFSFGVVDNGAATYKNLRCNNAIGAGTTVTINPGEAHSCNPKEGLWSYRMLFVSADWMGELQRELYQKNPSDYLSFSAQYHQGKASYLEFDRLYRALQSEPNPLIAETLMIEYCRTLFQQRLKKVTLQSSKISLVREMIMDSLAQNLSLTDFCNEVDLSPFHLIRSFKASFGQSPHAYQLDQRIKRSMRLLQNGNELVDVAADLGFADQSHFQRHFKKRTALTPRQYQRFFV